MTLEKSKIKDISKLEKDLKWKKIKHNPNSLECAHCKFDEAEKSLKDKIKSMSNTDTIKAKDTTGIEKTYTINKMIVKRGKYDDVLGWEIQWQ